MRLLLLRGLVCLALAAPVSAGGALVAGPAGAADCPASGGAKVPAASANGDVVFRGHGWGHGLGMSQYGAQGAAKLGCGYRTILSTYYRGSTLSSATMPRTVRLRMLDNGARADVTAETGAVTWQLVKGATATNVASQPKGASWRVLRTGSRTGFRLVNASGSTVWRGGAAGQVLRLAHSGAVVRLVTRTWNSTRDEYQTYLDRRLRWDYTRFAYDGAWLDATQLITTNGAGSGMQKYLWGIAEVPTLFPVEALKAQAVAARTYAARVGGGSASRPLMPTPADQNYTGYAKESEDATYGYRWRDAVNATGGEVLKDGKGAFVVTYYSSSMGGYTEDVRYVGWSSAGVGYLRPVDDSRWDLASSNPATYQSWAQGFSWTGLADRLRTYGRSVGDTSMQFSAVSAISVPARGASGRVEGVRVTGRRNGRLVTSHVSGWDVRQALGLPSPGFTVSARRIGGPSAQPLSGDWNGDGDSDVGWFKAGSVALSMNGRWTKRFSYGRAGDLAVVGDWDGDGRDSIGVFRAGTWLVRDSLSSGNPSRTFTFGQAGDRPVVGRWNGTAVGVGVVRGGTWYLRDTATSGSATRTVRAGSSSYRPVAGDWDGNGPATVGLWRAGGWRLRNTLAGPATVVFAFGTAAGDRPVVGDWDGNGSVTAGIVRGQRFLLKNGNSKAASYRTVTFRG